MWVFFPSLIHSYNSYTHHGLLIYNSCRITVAASVQIFIVSGYMFSYYLADSVLQHGLCTWSYWGFQPQRHGPSSCHIIRKNRAMILIMPLVLTLEAPKFFVHFWPSHFFLLKALKLQAEVLQLHMNLLNYQCHILDKRLM